MHVELRNAHVHRLCKNLRGRHTCRWENNIKMKKRGCEVVGWIKPTKDKVMKADSIEYDYEPFAIPTGEVFHDEMNDGNLL